MNPPIMVLLINGHLMFLLSVNYVGNGSLPLLQTLLSEAVASKNATPGLIEINKNIAGEIRHRASSAKNITDPRYY